MSCFHVPVRQVVILGVVVTGKSKSVMFGKPILWSTPIASQNRNMLFQLRAGVGEMQMFEFEAIVAEFQLNYTTTIINVR